jgi:DNA-directed RNA polymerase subunit K/omega
MDYCWSVAKNTTDWFVQTHSVQRFFSEEGRMTYIPRQKVTALIPNKFEAIKIAALEARRLNERARMYNVSLPGKITTLAVDRLIEGKIEYYDQKERARQVRLEREQEDEE